VLVWNLEPSFRRAYLQHHVLSWQKIGRPLAVAMNFTFDYAKPAKQ
jgi:hypothetical protein